MTIRDGTCYAPAARWHDQLVRAALLAALALAGCGGSARDTIAGVTRCGGSTGVTCSPGQTCARDPALPCPTGRDCAGTCAGALDLASRDLAESDGLSDWSACSRNGDCATGVCCFAWSGFGPLCSTDADCPPASAGRLCFDSLGCALTSQACCPTGLTGLSACAPGYAPGCQKFCDTDADCPGAHCLEGTCHAG